MPNASKDYLFVLISALSKSEKRQFKLYVNRLGDNVDAKFFLLFKLIEKMNTYDEDAILKSNIVSKQQLPNVKAHLYKQILISLRMNPVNQNIRIQIREQLDFATILYHKGLYKQSLKLLEKAKMMAIAHEEKNVAYEIVELEKVIESQYITRSISTRADELTAEAEYLSEQNGLASQLSNLSLQLYSRMLKSSHAKSEAEVHEIETYFEAQMPQYEIERLGFREKLWLFQAYVWYGFLVQDFLLCYRYSKKWLDLFYDNSAMIFINPVWYIKGNSYLLECLYLIKHKSHIKMVLENLEKTIATDDFPKNDNLNSLYFLCYYSSKFNLYFLEGDFVGGLVLVDNVLLKLKENEDRIDEHHIMVFYYKIACLYFGAGNNLKCIEYLNKIIKNKNLTMREDLMCFARVLNLVAHYEADLVDELELQLRTTYQFLIKMNDLHEVQREMIRFLKNLGHIYPNQLKLELKNLHSRLKTYENHPYEKRAFLYLDVISWLESKIENRPVAIIIQEKAKLLMR